ncbi:MAG: YceI family protein [Actinomycetes bacterium]
MTTTTHTTTDTATTTGLAATTGTWKLDPSHTRLGFSAKHAMVSKVRGSFGVFEGELVLDGQNPSASRARVVVDTASIDSGSEQRDGHLKSPDFLDVETYPQMVFEATSVTQKSSDTFEMVGTLTVKDVSRPLTITAQLQGVANDPFGATKIGFEGSSSFSRKDFGLTWNVALEAGGVLVGDKVTLSLDVEADKVS